MRSVIKDDDFEILVRLVNNGLNGLLEQVGPIVIGDDDADRGRAQSFSTLGGQAKLKSSCSSVRFGL